MISGWIFSSKMAASLFEKLSEIFISTVKAEEEEEEEEEEVKKTIWIIF